MKEGHSWRERCVLQSFLHTLLLRCWCLTCLSASPAAAAPAAAAATAVGGGFGASSAAVSS
jgi:hypothetical protein